MSIGRIDDLQAFREFVDERLGGGAPGMSLDEALSLWEYENQTEAEREETLEAIRRGLEDVDAGRTRPAEDVIRELCRKYGLDDPTR